MSNVATDTKIILLGVLLFLLFLCSVFIWHAMGGFMETHCIMGHYYGSRPGGDLLCLAS